MNRFHFLSAFVLAVISLIYCQLDTSTVENNKWLDVWPGANPLPINGSNWAYENDLGSHPFYPFFIMGPGHVVHPQDCYWYPYDPQTNKWTKINSPNKHPRSCLGSFTCGSQDTTIFFLGGGEAGHQLSQGSWNSTYTGIDVPDVAYQGTRGVQMWVYEFNRNRWHHMKGLTTLPPTLYSRYPRYDPIHDVVLSAQGSETWVYNYHDNQACSYANPTTFAGGLYSNAVDEKRGLYYMLCGGSQTMHVFDPENAAWSSVSGTIPGCVPNTQGGGNEPSINALAYDPLHDIMLYLIGMSSPQTWSFNCATKLWQQETPAASPAIMGRVTFNRALNLFMLLGGEGTGISRGGGSTGVWFYRYAGGAPAEAGMVDAPDAVINTAGGTINLSWKSLSNLGVNGYFIYRGSANPYPKGFVKLNATAVTDTFYTDNTAAAATRYSYRVCAVKDGVEGRLSRHLYSRASRPLGAVASMESASQIKVTWYANPEPDIVGYNVYRGKGIAMYTTIASYTKLNSSPLTSTEYTDNVDVSDGVALGYVVTAVNGFGLESAPSPVAPTLPDSPEWAWTFPAGANMTLRWQPPARTKVIGVNLYRTAQPKVLINTSGLITDTVSTWPMPPQTGTSASELQGRCYVVRAVNVLSQQGFATDQISPINSDFGYGIVVPADRFNYAKYKTGGVSIEDDVAMVAVSDSLSVWPNPFNPGVRLSFTLKAARTVRMTVLNVNGRQVMAEQRRMGAGRQSQHLDLSGLSSGIYTVCVDIGSQKLTRKITLVR